ncbi:uncharacterized protein [Ovis canadensis]|uniref:uncharacterized protein isoform X2 n=1 Tax=Ovis canadensis TaxID=37174 RepID=UPI0037524821
MGCSTGAAQTQSGIILGHGPSMASLKWPSTREAPVVALRVANDSRDDFISESALFGPCVWWPRCPRLCSAFTHRLSHRPQFSEVCVLWTPPRKVFNEQMKYPRPYKGKGHVLGLHTMGVHKSQSISAFRKQTWLVTLEVLSSLSCLGLCILEELVGDFPSEAQPRWDGLTPGLLLDLPTPWFSLKPRRASGQSALGTLSSPVGAAALSWLRGWSLSPRDRGFIISTAVSLLPPVKLP